MKSGFERQLPGHEQTVTVIVGFSSMPGTNGERGVIWNLVRNGGVRIWRQLGGYITMYSREAKVGIESSGYPA
jgi:hypothetical protein